MHTLLTAVTQNGPATLDIDRLAQVERLEHFVKTEYPGFDVWLASELIVRWLTAARRYIEEWTSVLTAEGGEVKSEPLIEISDPWEPQPAASAGRPRVRLHLKGLFDEYRRVDPACEGRIEAIVQSWVAAVRTGIFLSAGRALNLPQLFALFVTVCDPPKEQDLHLDPLQQECSAHDSLVAPLRLLHGLERNALLGMRSRTAENWTEAALDQYLLALCVGDLRRPFSRAGLERTLRELSERLELLPHVGMLLARDGNGAVDWQLLKEDISFGTIAARRLLERAEWIRNIVLSALES